MNPTPTFGLLTLCCALMAGCSPQTPWEREYACSGQEQSSAYFTDSAPTTAIKREYPLTIDFHLRSGTALVKSAQVAVTSDQVGAVRLSASGPGFWLNGQFNEAARTLHVVDERALQLTGRTQLVRTAGQFVCVPSSGARAV